MARRLALKEEYFSWLYDLVGKQRRSYIKLCKELHKYPFRWSIHNDDNRGEDGLELRERYIQERNLDDSHLEVKYLRKGPCSMFEMLVALALRMDGITYDLHGGEGRASKWFYELLQNMRMSRFSDNSTSDSQLDPVQEAEVCDTLCAILDRTYKKDGTGSLFPLKRNPPRDMRTTEIWYQLMLWLDENYGL